MLSWRWLLRQLRRTERSAFLLLLRSVAFPESMRRPQPAVHRGEEKKDFDREERAKQHVLRVAGTCILNHLKHSNMLSYKERLLQLHYAYSI